MVTIAADEPSPCARSSSSPVDNPPPGTLWRLNRQRSRRLQLRRTIPPQTTRRSSPVWLIPSRSSLCTALASDLRGQPAEVKPVWLYSPPAGFTAGSA